MSAPSDTYQPFMRPVLDDVRHNPGAEIVRYARRRDDVLSLGMGEGDSPTPDFIMRAVHDALQKGETFYGPVLGRMELRQAISDYYSRIYGLEIPANRTIVTASGTSAVHLALTAVVEKGDEVVAILPIWKNLLGAIQMQQADIRPVCLQQNEQTGQWFLDLELLFAAVTDKTRAIVINSPNNPTGWVMPKDQMRSIMEFARKRGIWIISDEVYGRLVYDGVRADSFLDVADPYDRLLVVNSFSKNWAMTGWRLGWLVAPQEAEDKIYHLVLYDNMGPPNFLQFGGIAALEQGEDFLKNQISWFRKGRTIAQERFDALNGRVICAPPESTFYSFFRVADQDDCMALARKIIDDGRLGLAPGSAFGSCAAGYLRLCFAVSEPRLYDALDRLEKVIRD